MGKILILSFFLISLTAGAQEDFGGAPDEVLAKELNQAIYDKDMPHIQFLLAGGAKPETCIFGGIVPFFVAVRSAPLAIVEVLIKNMIRRNPALIDRTDGVNPAIKTAAIAKRSDVIEMLLDYGADPNIKDWEGETALFYSQAAEAKILLKHHATVDIRNDQNWTAFDKAVTGSNYSLAEFLYRYTHQDFSATLLVGSAVRQRHPGGPTENVMIRWDLDQDLGTAFHRVWEMLSEYSLQKEPDSSWRLSALSLGIENLRARIFKEQQSWSPEMRESLRLQMISGFDDYLHFIWALDRNQQLRDPEKAMTEDARDGQEGWILAYALEDLIATLLKDSGDDALAADSQPSFYHLLVWAKEFREEQSKNGVDAFILRSLQNRLMKNSAQYQLAQTNLNRLSFGGRKAVLRKNFLAVERLD